MKQPVLRRRLVAVPIAIALTAGAAGTAQAVHWPFFGGDNGRSGYQPVDEGGLPVQGVYQKTDATEQFIKSSIITSTGAPTAQRLIFGTRDGQVNLQILATGAPVGPEAGVDVDEGVADLDVFGTRSAVPGANGASVSFADTSVATGLGQVYVVHNDDDGAVGAADIEVAQIDETTGALVRADVDVAGTDGFTIDSSVVSTGPAADGSRVLFFVARDATGADARLFRVPIAGAATTTASSAQGAAATNTGDIDASPLASPTLFFRLNAAGVNTATLAVGTATGVRTFAAADLVAGPASAVLGGAAQTPSVPNQPSGNSPSPAGPVTTAPFLYVAAATAGGTTTVFKLDGATLATVAASPILAGAPAPALAVEQESEPQLEEGKVIVTTGANLYLLSTAGMNPAGLLNRTSSLAPGTTGFAQTTAAASGDFIYVTNDQAQQLVLRLSDGQPVAGGEFAPYAAAVAAPNTGVGQPSISRGFVQFSGGTGAFVYRNADLTAPAVALTAPADGATVGGLVTLTATASDARGLLGVTFLLDGAVVGLDTVADSGSPFAATGATYSVQVDTTRLRAGGAVIEAVAEDTARQAASSRRRIVIANTPTPTPRRVAPAVSFTVTPARDVRGPRRFTVRGRIAVPAGVRRADACRGRVTVRYKARTRTISTRRVSVTRACTFSARITFRVSGRFAGARTLAVRVRFAGNRVLLPRQARSRVVRVR